MTMAAAMSRSSPDPEPKGERTMLARNSGEAETDDDRVTVIGPDKLAKLVADAGLFDWLIRKVS
jgi:hypothetical protein